MGNKIEPEVHRIGKRAFRWRDKDKNSGETKGPFAARRAKDKSKAGIVVRKMRKFIG